MGIQTRSHKYKCILAILLITFTVIHFDRYDHFVPKEAHMADLKAFITKISTRTLKTPWSPERKNNKVNIAVLVPSCSRTIKHPNLGNFSLLNLCFKSFFKTYESKYNYFFYIGVDKNDYLESKQKEIKEFFCKLNGGKCDPYTMDIKTIVSEGGTFTKSSNYIARIAFNDGMDYLMRTNDDTEFVTANWTTAGINKLKEFKPPNIGVVGPLCAQGNTKVLNHDMVHRTHLEIFEDYYAPEIENWWADDWITLVYRPGRSSYVNTWRVEHRKKAHGTRYTPNMTKHTLLEGLIAKGRVRLRTFLKSLEKNQQNNQNTRKR